MIERRDLIFLTGLRRAFAAMVLIIAGTGLIGQHGLAAQSNAIPVIELGGGDFLIEPARGQASYFLDYSNALEAGDLFTRLDEFTPVATQNLGFDAVQPGEPRVWFHFRVRNPAEVTGDWMVNSGRPLGTIDMSAYRSGADGSAALIFECNARACPPKTVSPFVSGAITLAPGEQVDVLISQEHRFSSQSPIAFASPTAFGIWLADRNAMLWLMNGVWVAIIVMALLMGSVIGWRLSLAYAVYGVIGFAQLGLSEGTVQVIPTGAFLPFAEDFGLQFGLIFTMLFCKEFFQAKQFFPKSNLAMNCIAVISLINLVPIVMGVGTPARIFAQILVICALIVQVSIALRAAKQGQRGSIPVLLGAFVIFAAGIFDQINKLVGGSTDRHFSLDLIHTAFLTESALFAIAIVLKVFALQHDRDLALRQQLASTKESLRLSRDLQNSRLRFDRARRDIEDSKREIAAIGHDLMQPLGALRTAIGQRLHPSEEEESRLNAALSLIEGIARRDSAKEAEGRAPENLEQNTSEEETFPIQILLENTFRMFVEDANAKGITLKLVSCSQIVTCNPVALMRIASNLVVNAIAHSDASNIRIGCRRRGDHISFEVHDDGRGMSADDLEKAMDEGVRGQDSQGSGLGLAIVKNLCDQHGLKFEARSMPGKGTSFAVWVPIADGNDTD